MAGWIKKVKAFQFKGILVILGCFLFIGAILFAERSGLSYREKAKKLTYLDADKVVTEENCGKDTKANLPCSYRQQSGEQHHGVDPVRTDL